MGGDQVPGALARIPLAAGRGGWRQEGQEGQEGCARAHRAIADPVDPLRRSLCQPRAPSSPLRPPAPPVFSRFAWSPTRLALVCSARPRRQRREEKEVDERQRRPRFERCRTPTCRDDFCWRCANVAHGMRSRTIPRWVACGGRPRAGIRAARRAWSRREERGGTVAARSRHGRVGTSGVLLL